MSNGSQMMSGGSLVKALGTLWSASRDAKDLRAQSREAYAQGFADEQQQRRQARAQLGAQAAAIAQAGGGYGGTNELVMRDSELAAEMDALNLRYRGVQRGKALRKEAKRTMREGYLMAGSQLLTGQADAKAARPTLSNSGG